MSSELSSSARPPFVTVIGRGNRLAMDLAEQTTVGFREDILNLPIRILIEPIADLHADHINRPGWIFCRQDELNPQGEGKVLFFTLRLIRRNIHYILPGYDVTKTQMMIIHAAKAAGVFDWPVGVYGPERTAMVRARLYEIYIGDKTEEDEER